MRNLDHVATSIYEDYMLLCHEEGVKPTVTRSRISNILKLWWNLDFETVKKQTEAEEMKKEQKYDRYGKLMSDEDIRYLMELKDFLIKKMDKIPRHEINYGKHYEGDECVKDHTRQYEFPLCNDVNTMHLIIKDSREFFKSQKGPTRSVRQIIPLTDENMSKMSEHEIYTILTDFE